ncbi:hypothetical protein ACXYMU_13595 [Pontibacter sp. CAU 1760]
MKNSDNFRTRKDDGGSLGDKDEKKKIADKPAPRKVDRESENTPPDHEVYVDLEPDELHIGDEEVDDASKKD